MFRIVTEMVEQPVFYLLCDHRNCIIACMGPAPMPNPEELQHNQQMFFTEATKQGWMVALTGQWCPGHAQQMKEVAAAAVEKSRLIVPPMNGKGEPLGVWDGKLVNLKK